jgi:hypothetical protein
MQTQGLSISQVQSVTGHNSVRMTEHYSHLDARQISKITEAQAAILGNKKPKEKTASPKKPVRNSDSGNVLKFEKKAAAKKTARRIQAV